MKIMNVIKLMKMWLAILFLMVGLQLHAADTLIVTAEGLADPNSDAYKRDKGLMIDDLRRDARKQAIEKAVGVFVDSSTLVENYALIHDRVLSKSQGIIKSVIKESPYWISKDGFAHILIKAEVYITSVKDALRKMSKIERLHLIKEYGNPTISVRIDIRDAQRGANIHAERSQVAENLFIEKLQNFGYRVWSEELTRDIRESQEYEREGNFRRTQLTVSPEADFSVIGEVKFKHRQITLKASGLTIDRYGLTSYSVRCRNNRTGEIIKTNNRIPRGKAWDSEDAAMMDIGYMVAGEFSEDFFRDHLMQPSKIYRVNVYGLPDMDTAKLMKKEFIGLRSVLNVDLRRFRANSGSLFEIEFAGSRGSFVDFVHGAVLRPLNRKFSLSQKCFKLQAAEGETVDIDVVCNENDMNFNETPSTTLVSAPPERIREIVKDELTMKKVAQVNPEAVKQLANQGDRMAQDAVDAIDTIGNF